MESLERTFLSPTAQSRSPCACSLLPKSRHDRYLCSRPATRTPESDGCHAPDREYRGAICTITAGWQQREGEVDDLQEHLESEVEDLQLYRRLDHALALDQELAGAHRERQARLRQRQRWYRRRLHHSMEAYLELAAETGVQRSAPGGTAGRSERDPCARSPSFAPDRCNPRRIHCALAACYAAGHGGAARCHRAASGDSGGGAGSRWSRCGATEPIAPVRPCSGIALESR